MRNFFVCTALIASASLAYESQADPVIFQNELSGCLTIKMTKMSTDSNIVFANVAIILQKSISECGCKSALATYTSSVSRDGAQQTLQQGLLGLKSGGDKTLVLATEPALVASKQIKVGLACAAPL